MTSAGQRVGWRPRSRPSRRCSPIRADRWSCGQVIIYLLDEFGKEDEPLSSIAMKLKVHSPRKRPSLL